MDLESLQYTKDHYNRHAGQFADSRKALQARAEGPSAPLKKFHNTIKRRLIDRFAGDADSLLDLACGRGGDMIKWFDARIRYVKGIDLSPGEVAEARQRYQEMRATRASTTCEFVDTPLLGLQEWKEPQQYDVVTCMFALHYFFVAEAALKQFLHNVSANLKPGGYFVGTVPDGKRINECIQFSRVFDSPMLRIEPRWQGAPQTFGSAYVCAIGDTVTSSEKATEGSLEYLVYSNVLQAVAAQYGLRPVLDYGDAALEELFDPADVGKLLKHFAPHFRGSDPSLERASKLFTAFVFQKVAPGEEPRAGAAAPVPGALARAADLPPVRQPSAAGGGGCGSQGAKRGREDEAGGEGSGAADEQQQRQQASGSGEAAVQPSAAATAPAQTYKRPPQRRRRHGAASEQAAATVTAGGEELPPAVGGRG